MAEKVLSVTCKPQTLAYCPTMDLVALASEDEQVHVYRLNGQRVFGGVYGNGSGGGGSGGRGEFGAGVEVKMVRWKASGRWFFLVLLFVGLISFLFAGVVFILFFHFFSSRRLISRSRPPPCSCLFGQ